jgi:predicted nucleic acid-binding protein
MIVVDTNLIIALQLEGPGRAVAESVLARDPAWAAPVLWRSEMRNALVLVVRHSGLELSAAAQYCARAQHLLRDHEHFVADGDVLLLAAASGCSAYDCEFVALAEQLDVTLVTFDREVLEAFPGTAIHPKRFASGEFWGDRVSEALSAVYAGSGH